uniref:Pleiotropic drug resistance protein 3 n=1 Tax=Aegilops tauschii TaxID=37682 RepID=M8CQH4_AEGTA
MGEEEQGQDGLAVDDPEKKTSAASGRLQLSPSSLREALSCTSSLSLREQQHDEEGELKWAAIERMPTWDRLHTSLPLHANANGNGNANGVRPLEPVDVRRLGAADRRELVHTLIADIHEDNLRLLRHQRRRMDRVGVRQPTVEVRWRNLRVDAECQVVDGKPLPTLLNSVVSTFSLLTTMLGFNRHQERIHILKDVTGILKPSRMTLLLGPPGCGKTTLLLALAGKLNKNLKVTGEIDYNGVKLQDFVPEKTAAYIGQYDLHVPEMTVRETLDFSARFQGVGSRAEIMKEVIRREKEAGITPDPNIDTYMKAISVEGLERSMQTDYIMKIMGLDICADVLIGDAMRRGISGGEKKRLTTGEMIVGPSKALFMDEISTGLDSSTTFQIVSCLQQLAHISESTILVSLLQPAPETYQLFDDIILMAEGKIVYHGPKSCIMSFFESCGFKCPGRKGDADFLQEVLSKKDQQQYWSRTEEGYNFVTIDQFCDKFKASQSGQNLAGELSKPYDESKGDNNALSFSIYSLSKWDLLKACFARELLLMKRNAFIYIAKTIQLGLLAVITGTVFLRTRMSVDRIHANYYMGSLFYALLLLMVNGFPELAMTIDSLPVFYKQRDDYFYPAWAYAIPSFILKIPVSLVESVAWTTISYYLIGYTPEASRFFCQLLVLFLMHTVTLSMFRCIASYCQTMVAGSVGGLTGNEFLAQRWLEIKVSGVALGRRILMDQGVDFSSYFYWISIGALLGFTLMFNVGFAIGLTIKKGRMVLPFTPLIISFQDVNYYVDTPAEMRGHGYIEKKLQLLHNITGAFQPGVLSALMGVTGAGKTTLLDVLSGRKTGGVIEGDIRIGGYPKIQQTFARISGYCEQTDVHSPQITVSESVAYSAWLRFPPEVDSKARNEFVKEVLEIIELDEIRDSLVGIPGANGLSTEQRKRLTIAVELVSNPSIIFMDEPTSGLDARAAAIVMRAVKNVADTGRTVVCTIHQPSIDIFEAFDELMLMKRGGELIYAGPVGHHSCEVIKYFQAIPGVARIKENYNPSTWMLEVTSTSMELQLGVDFAQMYRESSMCKDKDMLVKRLSMPVPGTSDLHFPTQFPQKFREQFKACLWKQCLSYWRTPSYNLVRIVSLAVACIFFGVLFWQQGNINHMYLLLLFEGRNDQQGLFTILGCMYGFILFSGVNNCQSVMPFVSVERSVVYRERFAGMYSPWAYSFAQVVLFMLIAYPMIGYEWTAAKFFWFMYTMLCTLLYFVYLGMLMVSLTPNIQVASILASMFYTLQNLMSGFIVPAPQIPKWWIWLYYISPMSWTLNVFFTTQFGDHNDRMIVVFGETKSVSAFMTDYFGFRRDLLPLGAVALAAFPVLFAVLFGYNISKLNFQRR